jgi:hypothetical protein
MNLTAEEPPRLYRIFEAALSKITINQYWPAVRLVEGTDSVAHPTPPTDIEEDCASRVFGTPLVASLS